MKRNEIKKKKKWRRRRKKKEKKKKRNRGFAGPTKTFLVNITRT